MKIPTDIITKFQVAFTPPVHQEVSGLFFSRRLVGVALPIRLEDHRLKRQRRSSRVEGPFVIVQRRGLVALRKDLKHRRGRLRRRTRC